MYKYLLFVIFGILMYLFLNTSNNGFNVGGQFRTLPRTCIRGACRDGKGIRVIKKNDSCASSKEKGFNLSFYIFQEKQPTELPNPQLTQLTDTLGLEDEIKKLTNEKFDGTDIYDGYHVVGLVNSEYIRGPIMIGDKTYHLVYYHGIVIDHQVRTLNVPLLHQTANPLPYRPIDITNDLNRRKDSNPPTWNGGLWPIIFTDGELLPRIPVKYYVHSVCKSNTIFGNVLNTRNIHDAVNTLPKNIHGYIMQNFTQSDFFNNGINESINVRTLFETTNGHIEFHLEPDSGYTLLVEHSLRSEIDELSDDFNDCIYKYNNMDTPDSITRYTVNSERLSQMYLNVGYEDTQLLSFRCENWTGNKRTTLPSSLSDKYIIFTDKLLKYII
jgi:hypothetical protein